MTFTEKIMDVLGEVPKGSVDYREGDLNNKQKQDIEILLKESLLFDNFHWINNPEEYKMEGTRKIMLRFINK